MCHLGPSGLLDVIMKELMREQKIVVVIEDKVIVAIIDPQRPVRLLNTTQHDLSWIACQNHARTLCTGGAESHV